MQCNAIHMQGMLKGMLPGSRTPSDIQPGQQQSQLAGQEGRSKDGMKCQHKAWGYEVKEVYFYIFQAQKTCYSYAIGKATIAAADGSKDNLNNAQPIQATVMLKA